MKKGMIKLIIILFGAMVAVPSTAQSLYTKTMFQAGKSIVVSLAPKRVLGGPYSTNRLKGSDRTKLAGKSATVKLKATFPSKLRISGYDIRWEITSSHGKTYRARGKSPTLNLAAGDYRVKMTIQKLTRSRNIRVKTSRNSMQMFPLALNAGILKTRVSSGRALVKVKNSAGTVVASSRSGTITKLLPAGKYTINSNAKGRNKTIRVVAGQIVYARLKTSSSIGTVELRALHRDGSPLLQKDTKIVITSKKGKRVKSVSRSTLRLTDKTGDYNAVLSINGKVKKRVKFTIVSNKTKEVKIQM